MQYLRQLWPQNLSLGSTLGLVACFVAIAAVAAWVVIPAVQHQRRVRRIRRGDYDN